MSREFAFPAWSRLVGQIAAARGALDPSAKAKLDLTGFEKRLPVSKTGPGWLDRWGESAAWRVRAVAL